MLVANSGSPDFQGMNGAVFRSLRGRSDFLGGCAIDAEAGVVECLPEENREQAAFHDGDLGARHGDSPFPVPIPCHVKGMLHDNHQTITTTGSRVARCSAAPRLCRCAAPPAPGVRLRALCDARLAHPPQLVRPTHGATTSTAPAGRRTSSQHPRGPRAHLHQDRPDASDTPRTPPSRVSPGAGEPPG
jgi:hypothetical protein